MDIRLENVSFLYPKTNRGLRPLSTRIPAGKWTALVGRSGSGKSTLLRVIAGLLQPQTGQIHNPSGRRPGLVLQFPEHHFFSTTVHDEIAFGLLRAGVPRAEIRSRVVQALAAVGLDEAIAPQSPFRLSGGDQRLVAIAAALALDPPLLLLDEPAAGLDPRQRQHLFGRIDAWRQANGVGVVLSSHDMDEVASWAEHLLVLKDGRLVYDGPMNTETEVFVQAAEWGIGVPCSVELLMELRSYGLSVPLFAKTPEEAAAHVLHSISAAGQDEVP